MSNIEFKQNFGQFLKKIISYCFDWILFLFITVVKALACGGVIVLLFLMFIGITNIIIHNYITILFICFGLSIVSIISFFKQRRKAKKRKESLVKLKKIQDDLDDLRNPNKMYDKLNLDILQIRISRNLIKFIDADDKLFPKLLALRVNLINKYGYMIPMVRCLDSSELKPYEYQILVRENTSEKGAIYPDKLMVQKKDWIVAQLPVTEAFIEGINPIDKTEVFWITKQQSKENQNIKSFEPGSVIIMHLKKICIKNADKIITFEYIQKLFEHNVNKVYIDNLIPNLIPIVDLQKILVNLVGMKVSIKDITYILQKLSDYARYTNNVEELTDRIIRDLVPIDESTADKTSI